MRLFVGRQKRLTGALSFISALRSQHDIGAAKHFFHDFIRPITRIADP